MNIARNLRRKTTAAVLAGAAVTVLGVAAAAQASDGGQAKSPKPSVTDTKWTSKDGNSGTGTPEGSDPSRKAPAEAAPKK